MKKLFILLCGLLHMFSDGIAQVEYKRAIEYMENDLKDSEYVVSPELIPFNLNTVSDDVIRKGYLKDYDIFRDLSVDERRIERDVNDSLGVLEKKLNVSFRAARVQSLKKFSSDNGSPKFVLFFSCLNDNLLYLEVLNYNNSIERKFAEYGTAKTYLFSFGKRGVIEEVYKGTVSLN